MPARWWDQTSVPHCWRWKWIVWQSYIGFPDALIMEKGKRNMHMHMHTHVHTHTCTCTHTLTHTYMYMYITINIPTCTCIHKSVLLPTFVQGREYYHTDWLRLCGWTTRWSTVLSTNTQPDSTEAVLRHQQSGSRTSITCPTLVVLYNRFMGSLDRNDQFRKILPSSPERKQAI